MRYLLSALVIALVGIVVGAGSGSYLTYNNVMRKVGSIPASPVVLQAKYDKKKHQIDYSILNPGTLPLTIVEKSFVFRPGKETKEKAYVVADIPANIALPPGAVTMVSLKLKEETEKLKIGDVVVVTFTYTHPLSKDLYTVVHPFTYSEGTKNSVKEGK